MYSVRYIERHPESAHFPRKVDGMFCWRSPRVVSTLLAVVALSASTLAVSAQTSPVQVVQSSDGTLYLAQGPDAWTIVPDPISDDDLAALVPSGDLSGAIPAPFLGAPEAPGTLEVVQAEDGSLYIAQGSNVWTLVPRQIAAADLKALTVVGEMDGTISAPQPTAPEAVAVPATAVPEASAASPTPSPTFAAAPLATPEAMKPIDIGGQWILTSKPSAGDASSGRAVVVVAPTGALTMTWTSKAVWTYSGTLAGAHISWDGRSGGLTSHAEGVVDVDGIHMEGTWAQSDGQHGTWAGTRLGRAPTVDAGLTGLAGRW